MNTSRENANVALRRIGLFLLCCLVLVGFIIKHQRQRALDRSLIDALKLSDIRTALALLDAGANPNVRAAPPPTPSLRELFDFLIHPAPPEVDESPTAFLMACGAEWSEGSGSPDKMKSHDLHLVEVMLRHGANVNAMEGHRFTPLMVAVQGERTELISLLLKQGASVDLRDMDKNTVLHHAALATQPEVLSLLFSGAAKGKIDIDAQNAFGDTALMVAAEGGRAASIKVLLEHGAEIDLQNYGGKTAELLSVSAYSAPELQSSMKNRAPNNAFEEDKIVYSRSACTELLLAHHASVGAKAHDGKTHRGSASKGSVDSQISEIRRRAEERIANAQKLRSN